MFMEYEELTLCFKDLALPRIIGERDIKELQEPGVLYHGTPIQNISEILRRGLLARLSVRMYSCLTPNLEQAIYFTNFVHHLCGLRGFGVLCIDKNKLPQKIKEELETDPQYDEGVITRRDVFPKDIQKIILANHGVRKYSFDALSAEISKTGKKVKLIDYDSGNNRYNFV